MKILIALRCAGLLAAAMPTAALAHHPMDGATPDSFVNGLLSGIGHPVLGFDHLAFIVGIGILMAASRSWQILPMAFVATLVPGVLVHFAGFAIGPVEVYVAASVLLVGLLLLAESRLPSWSGVALSLLAGFCHGYAFGETIVGAETTPIAAYLVGLALTTGTIMLAMAGASRLALDGALVRGAVQRIGALALMGFGGVLLAQASGLLA